jgi:hypothetical protein
LGENKKIIIEKNLKIIVMKTQIFLITVTLFFATQFLSNKNHAANVSFNVEVEEQLVIEDWMTNDALWGIAPEKEFKFESNVEEEEELVIEDWMTDYDLWRL